MNARTEPGGEATMAAMVDPMMEEVTVAASNGQRKGADGGSTTATGSNPRNDGNDGGTSGATWADLDAHRASTTEYDGDTGANGDRNGEGRRSNDTALYGERPAVRLE
ncbi:hypothetical protein GN958_ATG21256 [Phytophthora infestans]|uniref:Uncharacterized protein n=1 Tax=Phytophthora infestans TaxID=4787 RepID=A0A8S9TS24_PHYIN|nr:hypothetical protein GN958_ATG21256 [Phytophthora infestans]